MVNLPHFRVCGGPAPLPDALAAALSQVPAGPDCLVNADSPADPDRIVARCRSFAEAASRADGALIVTILHDAAPGLAHLATHAANAALWAFTRSAALDWAPKGIRVNAIGLGAAPAGPFEAIEQAGRAAAPVPAQAAMQADIVRTILAIAAWPSMTGQIIRLGA